MNIQGANDNAKSSSFAAFFVWLQYSNQPMDVTWMLLLRWLIDLRILHFPFWQPQITWEGFSKLDEGLNFQVESCSEYREAEPSCIMCRQLDPLSDDVSGKMQDLCCLITSKSIHRVWNVQRCPRAPAVVWETKSPPLAWIHTVIWWTDRYGISGSYMLFSYGCTRAGNEGDSQTQMQHMLWWWC